MNQKTVSSILTLRISPMTDCVDMFLSSGRRLNPKDSKTSRHLHPAQKVNFRKVALALYTTAQALGLTIPPMLLFQADEVRR
jgi:hypothetical protein